MLSQFVKFSIVGVVNTLIHYSIFYVCYALLDFYHLLASTIGFCVAVVNSFILNKYWTFNSKSPDLGREFSRFMVISVLALLVNLATMALLVEWLMTDPLLAQLGAIGLALTVNFTGNRLWSFR